MLLTISHTTVYTYDAPVSYALQRLRLRPLSNRQQKVLSWDLDIEGGQRQVSYIDHYGNQTDLVSMDDGSDQLKITARGKVETTDTVGVLGFVPSPVPMWHYRQQTALTEPGAAIRALAEEIDTSGGPLAAMHALSERIAGQVAYEPGTTYAATPAEDALTGGKGVCQDHAQIFISAARAAGVPARYVSGYLMLDDRIEQEAGHAWAEAWLPDLGWVGFDVSNGYCPDDRYVRVASGLDYRQAAPAAGMRQGFGNETMIVSLQVQQ
ncbi:transglutaminase family protein [Seohaeicola zhoushanensis]|uniref:Transglutaminase n=1 Tax=Seohaeicola zhoushanensis TaxID=1569283 RepID=A0A8J3MAQ0_9RHOB|nr:transglutaminase family protein [Seohaeicola zhoushanensis]GHF69061.1 transglutaminase [Seohaeicola zhoushanensis]